MPVPLKWCLTQPLTRVEYLLFVNQERQHWQFLGHNIRDIIKVPRGQAL